MLYSAKEPLESDSAVKYVVPRSTSRASILALLTAWPSKVRTVPVIRPELKPSGEGSSKGSEEKPGALCR